MIDLTSIHNANYIMLKDIDAVCKKNNIKYFLDYGTLLGAVRHKDFIPWDDDIDLVVLREDYNDFIAACRRDLPDKYQVVEYHDVNGYFWDFISRIEIKGSYWHTPTEVDQKYDNKNNRVSADIFILDKAPESKWMFCVIILLLKCIYLLAMGHRYKLDINNYVFPLRLIIKMFSAVGKIFSLQRIFKWHLAICLLCQSRKKFSYLKNNALVNEMNFMFKKEWYNAQEYLNLRDYSFPVPANSHEVLTTLYNDYMKEPPPEKQVALHCEDYYIPEDFFQK